MELKYILLARSIGTYINTLSYTNPEKATEMAYRFFSQPRIGRLEKERLPKMLQEAQLETFRFGQHEFQTYLWKGNDDVVLLIHGWESNAARWEKIIPHLKKSGSTIIAIDAPAHGLSSGKEFNVPTYAEFINVAVQKFKPKFLIGHSIGGTACLYYQYKFPVSSIEKMVILGAPSDLKTLTYNYVTLLGLNPKTIEMLEAYFVRRFNFSVEDFSGSIFGAGINIKGMIAHDIDDDVVSFAESKKISGAWKNAEFIETKGLGHSMHDDSLYQKVCDFLFEAE